jgi:hypothetical protein
MKTPDTTGGIQNSERVDRYPATVFEKEVKPELDKYLPKLIAFCEEVLRKTEATGKIAVFLGRDGRGLFYLSKLLAEPHQRVKLKFIDLSHFYIESHTPDQRNYDYAGYFKSLDTDPTKSFFIDVGFRGTIIEDIRDRTKTDSLDDMLLVKEPNYGYSIYGFTEGSANGEDENSAMGHFLEGIFGGNVGPVEEFTDTEKGHMPVYTRYRDDYRKEIEHLVMQHFKKAVEEWVQLTKTKLS